MSNTFRASYSVLLLWSKGQYEEAVKTYFKLPRFENQAMKDGKKYHDEWSEEVKNFKTLPSVFGRKELQEPKTEVKMICKIGTLDWLDLVGIPDLIDGNVIYEFKTGTTNSSSYARTFQAGLYGILALKNGMYVDQIVFMHYNQHTKRVDNSYVWLSEERMKQAVEWVVTHASDMHNYLDSNNLYAEYGKPPEIENDDLEADIIETDVEELTEEEE